VHIEQERARHSVYAFKDGEKPHLWAKIFSLCIGELPAFGKIRDNAVFPSCIHKGEKRATLCEVLPDIVEYIED